MHCHIVCKYTKSSPLGGGFIHLVPLYSLMVAEEEQMNVAESPRRTGGDQTREEEAEQKPMKEQGKR